MATNRGGPFLAEALASLAAQTRQDFELIVVDDGSPDPDGVARAAAAIPGATLVRQDATGPAAARNAAIDRARGEWLAFLDDDDRWHPDRLAAQLIRAGDADDVVATYCGLRVIDRAGAVLQDADQVAVDGLYDVARRRTGILLPNLMVRREALTAVGGFDPSLRLAEDLDLVLKLAARGRLVFEPRGLVDYRVHDENVTSDHRALVRAIDGVLRRHRDDADDAGLRAALEESLRANARFAWWSAGRAASRAVRAGHPLSAIGELAWAMRTAPAGLADGVARRLRGGRDHRLSR